MGTAKTGSSALQLFFDMNRKLLLKNGALYPSSGRTISHATNHFRLYFCFEQQDHFLCPDDIKSPTVEWGEVLKEGTNFDSDLLVSSEALINLSIDHLKIVKEIVGSNYIIKPIIYIRRADHFLTSLYNQLIKEEELTSRYININQQSKNLKDQYRKIIDISNLFGKDQTIIRPFEINQFYIKNIFSDFLHYTINIELTDKFIIPEQEINHSLGQDTLEYKRLINSLSLTVFQKNKSLPGLLKYSIEHKEKKSIICSNKDYLKLIEAVQEEEKWIATEILKRKEGKLFYAPTPEVSETYQPYEGFDLLKAIEISKYLLKMKFPEENNEKIAMRLKYIIIKNIFHKNNLNKWKQYSGLNLETTVDISKKLLKDKFSLKTDKQLNEKLISIIIKEVMNEII